MENKKLLIEFAIENGYIPAMEKADRKRKLYKISFIDDQLLYFTFGNLQAGRPHTTKTFHINDIFISDDFIKALARGIGRKLTETDFILEPYINGYGNTVELDIEEIILFGLTKALKENTIESYCLYLTSNQK